MEYGWLVFKVLKRYNIIILPIINTSLHLAPPIRDLESFSFCSLISICDGGWMKFVCMSRASFLFLSWRRKLQEVGIVDISFSFNNDCDRQPAVSGSQSDSRIVC